MSKSFFDSQKNLNEICIKLRRKIRTQISNHHYNDAIGGLTVCSGLQYVFNQSFFDEELEDCISILQEQMFHESIDWNVDSDCVIFYDGFGRNTRGLALIYLRALAKIPGINLIYIKDNHGANVPIPDIERAISNVGEMIVLKKEKLSDKVYELVNVIDKYKPKNMFFYTLPNDAVAAIAFKRFEGKITRFQINLTDHAFWLGARSFDYCLEFRNYGASISNKYRKIDIKKLKIVPYYPVINEEQTFQGYPFAYDSTKQRIVFSGGSLYKTLGAENRYYDIIRHILDTYTDVIFWYAGEGDRSEMDKLASEYPGRVYLTEERSDLFQVLKRCYFYLSTYPICGGLMFQYAARAGKLPLTLRHDDVSDEFLILQDKLDIIFNNTDDLYRKIDLVMSDTEYLKKCEGMVSKSVISIESFDNQIFNLIKNNSTDYKITLRDIDVDSLRESYLERLTKRDFYYSIAKRGTFRLAMKTYPIKYFKGCYYKLKEKLKLN